MPVPTRGGTTGPAGCQHHKDRVGPLSQLHPLLLIDADGHSRGAVIRDGGDVWKVGFRQFEIRWRVKGGHLPCAGGEFAASPSGARVGRFLPNFPAASNRRAFFVQIRQTAQGSGETTHACAARICRLSRRASGCRWQRAHPIRSISGTTRPRQRLVRCVWRFCGLDEAQAAAGYCTVKAPRAFSLKSS
jgi:hypothetical protein